MPTIKLQLNEENQRFTLEGDVDEVRKNKRLMFSLKRLGCNANDDDLIVPYAKENQIAVLQELRRLIQKFEYEEVEDEKVQGALESFYRESKNFSEFSGQAKSIRNTKFSDSPITMSDVRLHENFVQFHKIVSESFIRKPRGFQWLSAFHMAFAQHACNFSVPGAGKTTIVYAAYAYLKSINDRDKGVDKIVVIGPKSSFAPWENEFEECFGFKVTSQRISGEIPENIKKQHLASGKSAELTLISHHSAPRLQNEISNYIQDNNVMLVVDEAHRIKGRNGKNAKSVLEIGKEAKSRIILTGTPLPNGYEDLYNLFKFIYPYKYKDILGFHFANLKEMSKNDELDSKRVIDLIDNLSPFFIRIKKDDLKLPPVHEHIIPVEMDVSQREIYDFIESKYVDSFRSSSSATTKDILNKAKLIRLRQASTNPALLIEPISESLDVNDDGADLFKAVNEKIADIDIFHEIVNYKEITPPKFTSILEVIKNKIVGKEQKIIIWTIFVKNALQLQTYLDSNGIDSKLLLGFIEQVDREKTIEDFNNPDSLNFQVVIANPFTVAESISLHKGCHNAIYMERDYNCSNFLQSKDRIHRVGLKDGQETNYYYFLSIDSIDEVINDKLDEKMQRMSKVIDSDIPLFSKLDDDETDLIEALIKQHDQRNSQV